MYGVINQISTLRFQQKHYYYNEQHEMRINPAKVRSLLDILKIRKIRGWCKDCGVIIYSRNYNYKFCYCKKIYNNDDYLETKNILQNLELFE
jgi:hypothetical protein